MKNLFTIAILLSVSLSFSQIESGLLLGLTTATTSEINAITGMAEGQMLYNSDSNAVYIYNGNSWVPTSNSNWDMNGNTANTTAFLGTINDVSMKLKSNNITILQFGRRQTLGLTLAQQDYNDNNQYLTYITGNNGVSALQFQADAASFYKPMFFTTSEGNFRLKGSAAQTDFFEIGSAGNNNNGEVEFIIGDDGFEPFIFKRFDYRDNLKKELFRIQGSSDSQNAKPRVGINTGQLANSTLQINGSLATAITTTSNNLTLDETHHTVIINANHNITLPNAINTKGRVYVLKNTTNTIKNISTYKNNSGSNTGSIPASSILRLQSNGSNWEQISGESTIPSSQLVNKSYVQTYKGGKNFGNGNATLLNLFPEVTIQAGKKVKIYLYVPTRNNTSSWGGLYVNINAKVNGTWYNLGNTGYDGGVMHSSATSIHALNHEMLLDFITNLNLPANQPYTLQFELTARSYNGTTYVNHSHDINRTANNLGSRGGLQTWASDQNYCHIIIEEKDR